MDFTVIIGLLGNLITFEEAGRGWLPILKKLKAKHKIKLSNWDSEDPAIQHILDAFKSTAVSEYAEHLFSDDEIDEIVKRFLEEKSHLNLSIYDMRHIKKYIRDILGKYNDYTRSLMSTGERILYDKVAGDAAEIESKLSVIANKEHLDNLAKFYEAVETSKSIGIANIECLINDEYEIDRSTIINKIKQGNERFISIQGCAGSGKSVLGKKLVEDEEYVLYARAEKFIQENNISDIWQCNLPEVLAELSMHKVVFFIDALEFIADCSADKVELLQKLYSIAEKYNNVYIITTCRIEDKNAFFKLQTKYSIKIYEIKDIAVDELIGICQKYPIIKDMMETKAYTDLLKSPFYINLIVSKMPDARNMQDENAFRDYIWRNIICLEDKAIMYGVSSDEIRSTIEYISFTRAKKFLMGVHQSEIKEKLLHILTTEGITIQKGEYVRLKYDIFEDICFERHFDKCFEVCRGNFQTFFEDIEALGRCAYRRYQIWVSNKLFLQGNREKFIYALIFSNCISEKWKNQTEIGIVKSQYCSGFFEEYFHDLVDTGRIDEVIRIINLYAFEAQLVNNILDVIGLNVTPVGKARECLILLLHKNWNNINNTLDQAGVIRLCNDYAKQMDTNKKALSATCYIIEYYIEQFVKNRDEHWYYTEPKTLMPLLKILYMMADVADEWLKTFFDVLVNCCISKDNRENRWACEIIEETLKNTLPLLARTLPEELCNLADNLWLINTNWNKHKAYIAHEIDDDSSYGLSKYATSYNMSRGSVYDNLFLWNIFTVQFHVGFKWAIQFINQVIEHYATNNPQNVYKISIYFTDEKVTREYYETPEMWLAGIQEHTLPLVISDILYVLKSILVKTINEFIKNKVDFRPLANVVKEEIYSKSNNIALLTIIEAIGMNYQKELPGYALDLATSFELLYLDIQRNGLYIKNPTRELLTKQILQIVGIPSLKERYELDGNCNINLQQYVINAQLLHEGELCQKCYEICDYLYSQTSNEGEDAQDYLQIQKMDLRNASRKKISENSYVIEPEITGEAQKIVRHKEELDAQSPMKKIEELVAQGSKIIKGDEVDYKMIDDVLDSIIESVKKDEHIRIQYEDIMVRLITISLSNKEISASRREYLCDIWINGIYKYFKNGTFVAENKLIYVLWMQIREDVSLQIKNRIKRLLLDCLLYGNENGLISKLASQAKLYLQQDHDLANAVFNTIIMLAEDEMNHQVYNANYYKDSGRDENFEFLPNKQLKLSGVDIWIQQEGVVPYKSEKEIIIEKFLLEEGEIEKFPFDIDRYDISILCYISNCGLDFSDNRFEAVMVSILHCLINLWNYDKSKGEAYQIVDVFQVQEIVELFQREIIHKDIHAECAIDMLFDNIDFTIFTSETINFYHDIFGGFVCAYFDSYSDKDKRRMLENKILYLDKKVNEVENDYVRIQLYKSVILSLTRYCHGDWSKAKTAYSYNNTMFLNGQFRKYGKYHVKDLVQTIYQLRMDELLPYILISLNEVFNEVLHEDKLKFAKSIDDVKWILDRLILKAFIYHGDEIKNDDELTIAFEGVLQSMIGLDDPRAAVILDEFRVH